MTLFTLYSIKDGSPLITSRSVVVALKALYDPGNNLVSIKTAQEFPKKVELILSA